MKDIKAILIDLYAEENDVIIKWHYADRQPENGEQKTDETA